MKFFGKFEKDNTDKIYRTKTFMSLNDDSLLEEPEESDILGTIFMLNPGGSRPLGSSEADPFLGHSFGIYVKLEPDKTMVVYQEVFALLKKHDKYTSGVIEIKNLFNFRKSKLLEDDWKFIKNEIAQKENLFNVDNSPKFTGDFVFFAWGTSKLKSKPIKEYAKQILLKALDEKNILYISSKNKDETKKLLSFYHPLGGHWKSEKRKRFNEALYDVFSQREAVTNFN